MYETNESATPTSIECRPSKDPAVRWFIFAAMAMATAVWCWSDRRPRPEAWDLENINDVAAYVLNNWSPYLLVPVALAAAAVAARHLTLRTVADDEGITRGRKSLSWSRIAVIDAAMLKSKGILTLRGRDGEEMKLDSWKIQRFKELVAFIESKLPDAERAEPK
jgi:hypothetical protein